MDDPRARLLNAIKKRVGSRGSTGFLFVERPFFEVDVQLSLPGVGVRLNPSLADIQGAINRSATVVLSCSKRLYDWGQEGVPNADRATFFDRITKDIEIVRVVLLLTGSIQGTKNHVTEYLKTFASKRVAEHPVLSFKLPAGVKWHDNGTEHYRTGEVVEEITPLAIQLRYVRDLEEG